LHCQTAAIMLMGINQMVLRIFANLRRICLRKWLTFGYVFQDTDVLDHCHKEEDQSRTQQQPRILCQEVTNKATQPTRAFSWQLENLALAKMALPMSRRPRRRRRFIAHRSRQRTGQQAASTDLALASGQWAWAEPWSGGCWCPPGPDRVPCPDITCRAAAAAVCTAFFSAPGAATVPIQATQAAMATAATNLARVLLAWVRGKARASQSLGGLGLPGPEFPCKQAFPAVGLLPQPPPQLVGLARSSRQGGGKRLAGRLEGRLEGGRNRPAGWVAECGKAACGEAEGTGRIWGELPAGREEAAGGRAGGAGTMGGWRRGGTGILAGGQATQGGSGLRGAERTAASLRVRRRTSRGGPATKGGSGLRGAERTAASLRVRSRTSRGGAASNTDCHAGRGWLTAHR
jgi:hypothetical protein